jgi:PhnB protein
MTKKALPRPEGHHTITPAFIVPRAAQVITFIEQAFGGKVVDRYDGPSGEVYHAEVIIDGSVVMLGEPSPDQPAMPAALSLYVATGDDVDATYQRALAAGATAKEPPKNQFYGYRSACVTDVGGNKWSICAVIEAVTREEIARRMADLPH